MKLRKIYYFSGTHWDREWYSTFQRYRFRLKEVADGVISKLTSDPEFTHFTFDGQTAAIMDYLEIAPENRDILCKLIREHRISAGPWFTMPDEFTVSGESLIHNLRKGYRDSRSLGAEPMKFGYVCDIFGHIAQLPQIFGGFGIEGALLGRGTNDGDFDNFIMWNAPDGTQVCVYRVPETMGYGCFCAEVINGKNENCEHDDKAMMERAVKYVEREMMRSGVPYVVLMDALDHSPIHGEAVAIAKYLSEKFDCPVVFDSLEELVKDLKDYNLQTVGGELNVTARKRVEHNKLIVHTLSSRFDLKKENDFVQTLLEKYALPMTAAARIAGIKITPHFAEHAYGLLLLNHAHDSICGCGIDDAHRDMFYRFRNAKQIAEELRDEAAARITCWALPQNENELAVTAFNPLPYERTDDIVADVLFPSGYTQYYYEQTDTETINAFTLTDADGNIIPYQIISVKKNGFLRMPDHGGSFKGDVYRIAFRSALPASGFARFDIHPSVLPTRQMRKDFDLSMRAENDEIIFELNSDGTFDLTDKQNGRKYTRLHSFIDDAEVGDGWFHYSPVGNREISSAGAPCRIEKISSGKVETVFRAIKTMRVPSHAIYGNEVRRSDEYAELEIASEFTVGGGREVKIKTTVLNNVCDHRLRLILPVDGANAKKYKAHQAFWFTERESGVRPDTDNWHECDKPERQFDSVVYRTDSVGRGIAFMSAGGLHEVAATDSSDASLVITLMRGFRRTIGTSGEPDGQLLKPLVSQYAIMPVRETDTDAEILRCRDRFAVAPYAFTCNRSGVSRRSLWRLESERCVMSIAECTDADTVDVRICNYSDKDDTADICGLPKLKAHTVNLDGKIINTLKIENGKITLKVKPWQIVTVRLSDIR